MKKILLFIVISNFLLTSCAKEKKGDISNSYSSGKLYFDIFNDKKKIQGLKSKVFLKGDTIAYRELFDIYFCSGNKDDFLKIAMVMADDYNNSDANYIVYSLLSTDTINTLNIKSNKLANYYLLKACEMDKESGYEVDIKERFDRNKPIPKSNDYWLEINN